MSIMDPLGVVEDRLGSGEDWPTYIIVSLFVDEPGALSIKNVAPLMYGNGIPVDVLSSVAILVTDCIEAL